MSLCFKSLCSSSAGNSLALWDEDTRIIIDCGFGSMKRCRAAFNEHLTEQVDHEAVLLSHVHSDHISYYPLRVLEQIKIPVYVHQQALRQLKSKHFNTYGFGELDLRTFGYEEFIIGRFSVLPIEVEHNPYYPTFGFVIHCPHEHDTCKIVIVTDFCRWDDVIHHFIDADFIFVESNHDLDLLQQYYNPNSEFHMPNPSTAQLLCTARTKSTKAPAKVMLGHISSQRNDPSIALRETESIFRDNGLDMDFELFAAPLREPSETIVIVE